MTEHLQIDGSIGEGGGQIIRTSLALSAITQKSFTISNVRIKRKPKPHLQPQHLMAAMAVKTITNGELINATIGSSEFSFYPNVVCPGNYEFDIGTAGSVILVAQTIIPILLTAKETSHIRIIGGTSVPLSPTYDYFENVFIPAIQHLKANVVCKLIRSGYYPPGKGVIELTIHPSQLQGSTDWQKDNKIKSIIRIANLPIHIAEREKTILLNNNIDDITIVEERAFSPGNVVTIWNGFKGATSLGKPGKLAEYVATEAVNEFFTEHGEVDRHLADQLLIYAAMGDGKTEYQTSMISNHLETNKKITSLFAYNCIIAGIAYACRVYL